MTTITPPTCAMRSRYAASASPIALARQAEPHENDAEAADEGDARARSRGARCARVSALRSSRLDRSARKGRPAPAAGRTAIRRKRGPPGRRCRLRYITLSSTYDAVEKAAPSVQRRTKAMQHWFTYPQYRPGRVPSRAVRRALVRHLVPVRVHLRLPVDEPSGRPAPSRPHHRQHPGFSLLRADRRARRRAHVLRHHRHHQQAQRPTYFANPHQLHRRLERRHGVPRRADRRDRRDRGSSCASTPA